MTKKMARMMEQEINSLLVWDRMLQAFDFKNGNWDELRVIKMGWNDAAKALNNLADQVIVTPYP